MNKTSIEWCASKDGKPGYTWNPVKGYCPVGCPYCYARRLYDRFGWDKTIRWDARALHSGVDIRTLKEPSRIFVGSTIELFGPWVPEDWLKWIFYHVGEYPQHTFIFLSKRPEALSRWNPWPDNAWVGATATDNISYQDACRALLDVEARGKFLSIEPLLAPVHTQIQALEHYGFTAASGQDPKWREKIPFHWLILGSETGNRKGKPALADVHRWAGEVIEAADKAGVPVFCKDNLEWPVQRREWPRVSVVSQV